MPFSCSGASKSFSMHLEKIQFFFFIMDHKSLHIRRSGDFLGLHSATLLLSHFAPTTMVFLQFLERTELMPASEFGSSPRPLPGPLRFPRRSRGLLPYFSQVGASGISGQCQWRPRGQDPGGRGCSRPAPRSCSPRSFVFTLTATLFPIACIGIRNR